MRESHADPAQAAGRSRKEPVRTMTQTDRLAQFRDLFTSHYAAVFAYAARRAGYSAAEDVVAETFLVAWRRYEEVPEEALPWLLKVAHYQTLNARRSARRAENLFQKLAQQESPAGRAYEEQLPEDADLPILRALARLAPADREVLMLDAWDDLDHKRAALVLGVNAVAFRVRLHRARNRLRRELDAVLRAEPPHSVQEREA